MDAKTTRILKEARPLFWPWCAVALSTASPLFRPLHSVECISVLGLFLGVPLLATLPLGNEFQYRTFPLLLSQPVGRMKIWREKLLVSAVAVVSAVLVFCLAFPFRSHPLYWRLSFVQGAWIIATLASATFWTLVAGSTIGGVALTIAVQFFIIIAFNMAFWAYGIAPLEFGIAFTALTVALAFLCYAVVMLCLSAWKLARFEATGTTAGDDLLTAGPDVMPGALAGWLRCHPTGAVLNLIRKELGLLRPLRLFTLLACLGWTCLTMLGLVHGRGSTVNLPYAVIIVGVSSTLIIAILAGSLSLGEERTSGTHAWHLTLPAPALLQWRIKLYMALFAGFVGAGLLPLLLLSARRFLFGWPHLLVGENLGIGVDAHFVTFWLLGVLLLSFASFWCASAANGTVRAVLWVLPVMIAVGLASEFGGQAGHELMNLFVSRFNPFTNFRLTNAVVSMFQTSATVRFFISDFMYSRWYITPNLSVLLVPTLLLAVIQSYRLFRAQLQESILGMIRNLFPLAMVAFLWTFSLMAFSAFVRQAWEQNRIMFDETVHAIEKIQPGAAKLEATHPLQLTEEDLAKAFPLSARTRRWLCNSRVTIVPIKVLPRHFLRPRNSRFTFEIDDSQSWYLATIYLAGGSNCTGSGIGWAGDLRMLYVVCQ